MVNDLEQKGSGFSALKLNLLAWAVVILIASVCGAFIVGKIGSVFTMPSEFHVIPFQPSPEFMSGYNSALGKMYSGNYAVYFSVLGASLGVAIGAVGAIQSRILSLIAATVGGSLAGAIGGYLLGVTTTYCMQVYGGETIAFYGIPIEPIVQTTALQCFVWAMIGVGIGSGWTGAVFGSDRILKGIEGGLLGGLLAGIIFSMIGAFLYSNSNAFLIVPESQTERLVWAAICFLSVGSGLVYSVSKQQPQLGPSSS